MLCYDSHYVLLFNYTVVERSITLCGYQDCVCLCVTEVGCSWGGGGGGGGGGRMFENIGHGLECSRTAGGCNWGAAVKSDAAAVEVDTIREQQSK